MPLFFLIAIGCGAIAVGATTVDVVSRNQRDDRSAQAQTTSFQASAYTTRDDCVRAAVERGLSASACPQQQ